MGKLVYSMAGEGRGHATRARALAEALRDEHEIVLWAPGQAYELLAPVYRGTDVRVERLPGVQFHYAPSGRLNYAKSLLRAVPFAGSLARLARTYSKKLEREGADLAICDFEPILSRAAGRLQMPLLGVDHQSFLLVNDLAGLSVRLRAWAKLMAGFCRVITRGVRDRVVSSFYFPPLKKRFRGKVTQVGVLIRPELRALEPRDDGHVLVYVRRHAPRSFLDALEGLGRPVHVYGLGTHAARGAVHFENICAQRFAEHLAGCHALISTAGNQGVGEALFFGKPVLAMPEHGNMEQHINAWFLANSGAGATATLEAVTRERMLSFLARHDEYCDAVDREKVDGLAATCAAIRVQLGSADPVLRPRGSGQTPKTSRRAAGREGALIRP